MLYARREAQNIPTSSRQGGQEPDRGGKGCRPPGQLQLRLRRDPAHPVKTYGFPRLKRLHPPFPCAVRKPGGSSPLIGIQTSPEQRSGAERSRLSGVEMRIIFDRISAHPQWQRQLVSAAM